MWTALNGLYAGTLVEIVRKPRHPWRGRILIDGVLEPACHYDSIHRRVVRRGFRIGETIEVGGASNVEAAEDSCRGVSYIEALERAIERHMAAYRRNPTEKRAWVNLESAKAMRVVLARCRAEVEHPEGSPPETEEDTPG